MYYANVSKRRKSFIYDEKNVRIFLLKHTDELVEIKKNARHEVISHGENIKANSPQFSTIEEAVDSLKKERAALNTEIKKRQEQNREIREKSETEQAEAWAKLQQLDVIPATRENIRVVLIHLNSQNWGVWQLPKLSIGYAAHQYDCEGSQATTITLDEPVDGLKKFKIGGKRGHLTQYTAL